MKINKKTNKILFLFATAVLFAGCSSDDDAGLPQQPEEHNYFPLSVGNSWSYDNTRQEEGMPETTGSETMSVADSTEENNVVFYDLETDQSSEIGYATSVFSNGKLHKTNGELLYNGEIELLYIGSGSEPIRLPINNAVVFNGAASAGMELSNFSDSVEQEITVQGTTVPLSLNYTVSTNHVETLNTYTVGETEFEDVLVADLKLTASASATIGPVQLDLLGEQEIVKVVNYYAEGVGMIHSEIAFDAEFEDLTDVGFPEIPAVHINSSQNITNWSVAAEE